MEVPRPQGFASRLHPQPQGSTLGHRAPRQGSTPDPGLHPQPPGLTHDPGRWEPLPEQGPGAWAYWSRCRTFLVEKWLVGHHVCPLTQRNRCPAFHFACRVQGEYKQVSKQTISWTCPGSAFLLGGGGACEGHGVGGLPRTILALAFLFCKVDDEVMRLDAAQLDSKFFKNFPSSEI